MIYHITDPDLWETALTKGVYRHPTLQREGFIHACRREQLPGVVARHFPQAEELWILHIVERRIRQLVRYDDVPKVGESFPHIYGPLPLHAIDDLSLLTRDDAGNWAWNEWRG